jgi:hypothetical protein
MNVKMQPQESEQQPTPEPPPQRPGPLPPPSVPPLRSSISSRISIGLPPPPDAAGFDALPATPGFSPDKAMSAQLETLEEWGVANQRDALIASTRFWLLNGLAFLCAVSASVAQTFGQGRAVIVLGAVAALAVAVNAAWTGPGTHVHRRAIQDIRNLQNSVKLKWDKVRISHPDPKDPARSAEALAILDVIQTKREDIARYLASPQASPGGGPSF